MKSQLIDVGLWRTGEQGEPGGDISSAWRILSRLGCPGRYGGRTPDGLYEYVIVNPETGALLTTGRGVTLEVAMCKAALAASNVDRAQS